MVQLSLRRPLGRSSVSLPPLGFGVAHLGELWQRVSDAEAAAALEASLVHGVRYFDVAPFYGSGLAEMRLGRALRACADEPGAFHVPREDIFVSTKVGRRLVPDRTATPNNARNMNPHGWVGGLKGFNADLDCTYEGFMNQHNDSLLRMGLPYVDGLLVHGPGETHGPRWEQLNEGGGFRALQDLRQTGAVKCIGIGDGPPCTRETCAAVLKSCPSLDYMCLAASYSLLRQPLHTDGTLQLAQDHQVGCVIFAPFNSGILAGPVESSPATKKARSAKFNYEDAEGSAIEDAAAIEAVCLKYQTELAAAALQFPVLHPAVTSVVCGVESAAEVEQNVKRFQEPIPADLWRGLREAQLLPSSVPLVDPATGEDVCDGT